VNRTNSVSKCVQDTPSHMQLSETREFSKRRKEINYENPQEMATTPTIVLEQYHNESSETQTADSSDFSAAH